MSNTVREITDWSMYPFRLMGQALDTLTKTTCDLSTTMTEAVRPEGRSESESGSSGASGSASFTTGSGEGQRSGSMGADMQWSGSQGWRGSSSDQGSSGSGSMFGGGSDLTGDDIKLVRSYVVFTKPGNERTSDAKTELVPYETNNECYAGVVVGRYLREHPEIDDQDFRYLKPHIEVIDRFPKEEDKDTESGRKGNESGSRGRTGMRRGSEHEHDRNRDRDKVLA